MLAEQLFAKALQSFETCLIFNNNLCGQLFSSLESLTIFDERFNVTLVFIAGFNFLRCELDNFTSNVLKWVIKAKIKLDDFCSSYVKNLKLLLEPLQ